MTTGAEEGEMRCCRRLVVAFFMAAQLAGGEAPGGTIDEIVGTWRGSSVCVDRQAAPACTDEQVVYEIRGRPGKPHMVTVNADKIVDGKRVPMGVLDFTHEAKSSSWITEFDNPRVREILAKHGWFQTVLSDLPHFTFLGLKEKDLPKHGLKSVEADGQAFWIPNVNPS